MYAITVQNEPIIMMARDKSRVSRQTAWNIGKAPALVSSDITEISRPCLLDLRKPPTASSQKSGLNSTSGRAAIGCSENKVFFGTLGAAQCPLCSKSGQISARRGMSAKGHH